MKTSSYMLPLSSIILAVCLVLFVQSATGSPQDEVLEFEYTLKFKTIKNNDKSRSLIAEFYGEADRDKYPVYEAEINFYQQLSEEKVPLGTISTDKDGVANLTLPVEQEYLKDEEGYITFIAEFSGNDQVEAFEEMISVIDLNLTMELIEEDGVRSILVNAYSINASGEQEIIEESDIYFYVKGMINNLTIESAWIEYGEYEFDFPTDIPGDKDGNLLILAKIEDNDDYGNVVTSATAKWGTGPVVNSKKTRKLWTDLGPEWMITVLTLLLLAVWANIIHAIYNLHKIRQEGRNMT